MSEKHTQDDYGVIIEDFDDKPKKLFGGKQRGDASDGANESKNGASGSRDIAGGADSAKTLHRMNLPNKLTLLRIVLVPFFAVFLSFQFGALPMRINYIIALILFVAASMTDFLDGYIAREYNLVTTFGKFADPLADKILVAAAFVCFAAMDVSGTTVSAILNPFGNSLPIIIILAREFMVSGLRLAVADKGVVVPAGIWGKLKTAFTMITIIFVLVSLIMGINEPLLVIDTALVWISVVLTVISGAVYLKAYKDYISDM
jgi:CDP-diacylglycerol--glycerol-3-phosphate 3-phosphatidyltransferase